MQPFVPLFRNRHLLTIAGNYWPRPVDERRFPVEERYFETEPGVRVLVHSQRPEGRSLGQLILVHGLEGSSRSGYILSLSQAALTAGYTVHRLNLRSCGGTEAVCGDKLYHSGQTGDLLAVIREIAPDGPVIPIGFSLGGNVVLKLAGELGERGLELLAAAAAVSTPIDLAACVRSLRKPENLLYERRFVQRLKQRIRMKEKLHPGLFRLDDLDTVKTVYDFDDRFTAPSFGFGNADTYYRTQSSHQYLERIRVPTLLVTAQDDPLVPFEVYRHAAIEKNPFLTLIAAEKGGHLGFVSRTKPRFWLDGVLLRWLAEIGNKAKTASVL